jgi:hypothetical protein
MLSLSCITNISAEILLHILGLQFLQRVSYFGTFLPNAVEIKSHENYLRKSCSNFAPKMLVILAPLVTTITRQVDI